MEWDGMRMHIDSGDGDGDGIGDIRPKSGPLPSLTIWTRGKMNFVERWSKGYNSYFSYSLLIWQELILVGEWRHADVGELASICGCRTSTLSVMYFGLLQGLP